MGILSKILGSGDVISEGFKLIDSIHTSDVEETRAKTKAKTDLLSAYAPFKIAQRYLATMFGASFLLSFFVCLGAVLISLAKGTPVLEDGTVVQPTVVAVTALMGAFKLHWIMLTIVGFYFGGGAFEGFQARKAERDAIKKGG